jgi:hypothetical protein
LISFLTSFLVKETKLSYFNFILGPLALSSIVNKLKIGGYLGEFKLMWPIGYIMGFTTLLVSIDIIEQYLIINIFVFSSFQGIIQKF